MSENLDITNGMYNFFRETLQTQDVVSIYCIASPHIINEYTLNTFKESKAWAITQQAKGTWPDGA